MPSLVRNPSHGRLVEEAITPHYLMDFLQSEKLLTYVSEAIERTRRTGNEAGFQVYKALGQDIFVYSEVQEGSRNAMSPFYIPAKNKFRTSDLYYKFLEMHTHPFRSPEPTHITDRGNDHAINSFPQRFRKSSFLEILDSSLFQFTFIPATIGAVMTARQAIIGDPTVVETFTIVGFVNALYYGIRHFINSEVSYSFDGGRPPNMLLGMVAGVPKKGGSSVSLHRQDYSFSVIYPNEYVNEWMDNIAKGARGRKRAFLAEKFYDEHGGTLAALWFDGQFKKISGPEEVRELEASDMEKFNFYGNATIH